MVDNGERIIINLILERKNGEADTDFDKFLILKSKLGITKPNTEIIRECIRKAFNHIV